MHFGERLLRVGTQDGLPRCVRGPSRPVSFLGVKDWGWMALIILSIHKHSGCLFGARLDLGSRSPYAVKQVPQITHLLPLASVSPSEERGWSGSVEGTSQLLLG